MDYIIELIKYILLGIIQGIAEVFPVSSSGHLLLFNHLLMPGKDLDTELNLLLTLTNMGSFLAIFIFFFKEVKILIIDFFLFIFKSNERKNPSRFNNFNYVVKLLIAVIPVGITGLIANHFLQKTLLVTGISLLATSILLLIAFTLRNKSLVQEISYKNALIIGLFQGISPVPGLSRSGITIVGGSTQKLDMKELLKFSFLCYLIISVPVSLLGIYDAIKAPGYIDILGVSLAFLFSFIFSLITIRFLYKIVTYKNLIWFSIYTFIIGTISIILYLI